MKADLNIAMLDLLSLYIHHMYRMHRLVTDEPEEMNEEINPLLCFHRGKCRLPQSGFLELNIVFLYFTVQWQNKNTIKILRK